MFILINVYTHGNGIPYLVVSKFDTIDEAVHVMNADSQKNYERYLGTWAKYDGDENTKPQITKAIASVDITGSDYNDYWKIINV